ncbi:hypothetical protein [Brachybacterium kimchii]|uniref:DNA-damage-inducible protein D n=1 Tax=Brachybacterium kimchii TaxID=2942909 RepID=A0ABY4N802_9MICO|nr:hypothetical protein [Brachybacterium kimchii]UQN30690.1 hypothetical protein M4486_05140 [Brachybacterium kimchii]
MTQLTLHTEGSPFDAIRRAGPDGTEYWSARELMPLLDYDKWERFADAVERARAVIINQELDPEIEASRLREPSGLTRQMREDFHLSRYAAYLVAMNGDPRKPGVASAQSYFAIRTREAELAPTAPSTRELTFEEKTLEVLSGLTARVDAQHRELEAQRPLVTRARTYEAHAGDQNRQEFAREICKALREQHGITVTQLAVYEFLGRKLHLFVVGDRRDHGHATSHAEKNGYAVTEKGTTEKGFNFATGRLTPRGQAYAWERIVAFAREHGHLDFKETNAA